MNADDVLEEFLLDPCCIDCDASDCINERRMADEIVRLRQAVQELQDYAFPVPGKPRVIRFSLIPDRKEDANGARP